MNRRLLGRLRTSLAAVGQMALSNYLLQSVLSSVVFLGWGLGLVGRLDYAEQLLYVAGVWALQLAGSARLAAALPFRSGRMGVAVADLLAA